MPTELLLTRGLVQSLLRAWSYLAKPVTHILPTRGEQRPSMWSLRNLRPPSSRQLHTELSADVSDPAVAVVAPRFSGGNGNGRETSHVHTFTALMVGLLKRKSRNKKKDGELYRNMQARPSLLTRAIDLAMKPQISRFAFGQALRMSEDEFVRGARAAGLAVHESLRACLQNDDRTRLQQMATNAMLAPALFTVLSGEVQRGRDEGDWAVDLMLEELAEQSESISDGQATLRNVLLVAGAQRAMSARMVAMHRLHVGSHLVVIGDEALHLWKVDRQRRLMMEHGAAVQIEVAFGVHKPQSIVLEIGVDGDALSAGDEHETGPVMITDLNCQVGGGGFWNAACVVKPWWQLL